MGAERKELPTWERALRVKIAFVCMAAVAGKEGDLKHLTDDLVRFYDRMNRVCVHEISLAEDCPQCKADADGEPQPRGGIPFGGQSL